MNEIDPKPINDSLVPKQEKHHIYSVRELQTEDIAAVENIARQWIKFPPVEGPVIEDEVQELLTNIHEFVTKKNSRKYFVACDESGAVVGFVCLASLDPMMQSYADSKSAIELKNLYVDTDKRRGKGVGFTLYEYVKAWASNNGFTEILLNSGPRYKDTGWPFYEKVIGQPVGVLKDFYGVGNDAPVWKEAL